MNSANHPAGMFLTGADPGPGIFTMGKLVNSVILWGYNQLPNYVIANEAEPCSLAWCIEPNYVTPQGKRVMETYVQYLSRSFAQKTVRRPFMSQIDVTSGSLNWTDICGSQVNICYDDGSGMTGKHVVEISANGARVLGDLAVTGTITVGKWRLTIDDQGNVKGVVV